MICAWKEMIGILPLWLRDDVDKLGKEDLQELRLRRGQEPELITGGGILTLTRKIKEEDIRYCVNIATKYSPWTASGTSQGYITVPGGHRMGLCGEVAIREGTVVSYKEISSVNIRVARDIPNITDGLKGITDSALILGAPGWGKTTLLRSLARKIAQEHTVSVVDERGELFPVELERGKRMDVLTGCGKATGIDIVLRSMGPEWIALDEITAYQDTQALLQAAGCGVKLLATAHASSLEDFRSRKIYHSLLEQGLFHRVVILRRDKSYYTERI